MNTEYSAYAIRHNMIMLGSEGFVGNNNSEVIEGPESEGLFWNEDHYKLNCALGWPKKLIFFYDIPSLANNDDALTILLETISDKPYVEGQRPAIEPNTDCVIVFGGAGEGLPIECIDVVAEFAKLHDTIPCYYLSGAEPVPITFEFFNDHRGDAHNLKLITVNQFENDGYNRDYLNYKRDVNAVKSKKYHFFVGKPRFHRYFLLALLAERKVLDKGILSYGWGGDITTAQRVLQDMLKNSNEEYMSNFPHLLEVSRKQLPYINPVECPYPNIGPKAMSEISRRMDKRDTAIYDSTWFHVSTETSNLTSTVLSKSYAVPSTQPLFYTEKTYRPMVLRQIGVTCGQQGHLAGLRNKGYKPWYQWDNASTVDMIYNDEERLVAQADAISSMCNWPDTLLQQKSDEYASKLADHNRDKIINSTKHIMVHPH